MWINEIVAPNKLYECFEGLDSYLCIQHPRFVKYLDLGCTTVRLLGFSDEFLGHIQKQLTFVVRDSAEKFDATIVLFKDDFQTIVKNIHFDFNPAKNLPLRIKLLTAKDKIGDVYLFSETYSKIKPVFSVETGRGFLNAFNAVTNTYYYGVRNLDPEEFIKEGHLFVQILNKILKSNTTNLVHGALVGMNNNGILFCARGQRGKSTLTVLSMMRGFEYVSDDYLTLQKEGSTVYSYPIYSIITLSPRMYNELYEELSGSRFVSNNARKDKYVINIKNFHGQFKTKYPVKFCMFPEIVADKEPSIVPCSSAEKGRAIVQLVHSTVIQMQDINDLKTIKKLFDMVKEYSFYKINLCNDIEKNTALLKKFSENYHEEKLDQPLNERMLIDITFDYANMLDVQNMCLLNMNKSVTNIYENLLRGVDKNKIIAELQKDAKMPSHIGKIINTLTDILEERELLPKNRAIDETAQPVINFNFIKEENYYFSFVEFNNDYTINLLDIKEN